MLKIARFLFVPVTLSLVSCAGFPKPANGSDTLAIGSFIVDFPDGFYGGSARTIEWPINLEITNSSTGDVFQVTTKPGGYFYFVTNGRDKFMLKSCSYKLATGDATYTGGANLSYEFTVDPGCVQYLGHFKMTTTNMRKVTDVNRNTTWTWKLSWSQENRKSEARHYLQDNAQNTPWLTYEIHSGGMYNTVYISGDICPTSFPIGPLAPTESTGYSAKFLVDNTQNGTLGAAIPDAVISVNGQPITYDSGHRYYYATLSGTYGIGSTFSVTITHSGMDTLTSTLTIPDAAVPATYTIIPTFNVGSSATPPYSITPLSNWMKYGTLFALLYDSSHTYQGNYYWTSLTGARIFSSANLSYANQTILASYVQFGAWSEDKTDFSNYGMNGISPSRLRVFAPYGKTFAQNY